MRSRSPTAPSRQHALPGFRRDHRSLGAAPRTPPEESCRSLRHPGRTVPHLGEGVRTPGKFRKFAEFRPGQADPGHHPVARVSRIQPARERHAATGLAAATAGAIGPTPAGRSVCTLSAGRPVLHEKQSACSALRLGRLPGTRRPWGDELDPIAPRATLRFRWPGMSAAEDAMAARLKIVQPWERSRRNGNVAVPAGLTASPNLTDVDTHGFWKDHAEISYGPMTISCDGKLDDGAY